MPRIAGVDIPNNKRIEISLRSIYGIGPTRANEVLKQTGLNPDKRAKDLTSEEVQALVKAISSYQTEGDLRKQVRENIERLRRIGSYRGQRHAAGLPVRGQRTRTNARTKRGKRMTVGALKKEELAKTAAPTKQ